MSNSLDESGKAMYTALSATMNFLGQDRSRLQYTVNKFIRKLSSLAETDMGRIKKLVRFLKRSSKVSLKV